MKMMMPMRMRSHGSGGTYTHVYELRSVTFGSRLPALSIART
jgi:hypothetical protein